MRSSRSSDYPFGTVGRVLGLSPESSRGTLGGAVKFESPIATLREPKNWTASANLASNRLDLFGHAATSLLFAVNVSNGNARITRSLRRSRGRQARGRWQPRINTALSIWKQASSRPSRYGETASVTRRKSNCLSMLMGRWKLMAMSVARFPRYRLKRKGPAEHPSWRSDPRGIDRLDFAWSANRERVQIRDVRASVYEGGVRGSAEFPFGAAGDGRVEIDFDGVDTSYLAREWKAMPVRLSGRANGRLTARTAGEKHEWSANLELAAPRLRVSDVPTNQFHATVRYQPKALEYEFTGEPAGGHLRMVGKSPLDPPGPPEGELQLTGVDLSRWSRDPGSLHGLINLNVAYRNVNGELTGHGQLEVRSLGRGDTEMSDRLLADLKINQSVVTISGPNGGFAGGDIRTRGRYDLAGRERGYISINLTGVDSRKLFAPFPTLARNVTATFDGQLRGSWRTSSMAPVNSALLVVDCSV